MKIHLFEKHDFNKAAEAQVAGLFEQLSPGRKQLSLGEILGGGNPLTLACCTVEGEIVGMALMCTYRVISGHKGWIEDVVVDEKMRGLGIGKQLMEKLLVAARNQGLDEVLLFTADHRTTAIKLYTQIGFQRRDSGLYSLKMTVAGS